MYECTSNLFTTAQTSLASCCKGKCIVTSVGIFFHTVQRCEVSVTTLVHDDDACVHSSAANHQPL